MDLTRITRPVIKFVEDNNKTICKIGGAILVEFARRKTGASIVDFYAGILNPYTGCPSYRSTFAHAFMSPSNSAEEAIYAIMKQAENTSWDSDKRADVRSIMEILKNQTELTDDTKKFAIQALGNIADTSDWSSTKREISNYIASIGQM